MPAKVAKQQKKGKNIKRQANHKKKAVHEKSAKLNKQKIDIKNGHSESTAPSTDKPIATTTESVNAEQEKQAETLTQTQTETETETPKEAETPKQTEQEKEKEREKNTIEILQRRRLQACYLGEEFMSKHNFEMARIYFEQSLNRNMVSNATSNRNDESKDAEADSKELHNGNGNGNGTANTSTNTNTKEGKLLPELSNELDTYCKLLICRMHCDNSNTNLSKAVREVNYILSRIPQSVHHHIIKAELNIRLNRFDEVGACLLRAAEMDQPDILDSVHLYFHQIAQNTQNTLHNEQQDTLALPGNHPAHDIDIEKLCKFFDEMTLISQQNILSLEWQQIADAIDSSSLCDNILSALFSESQQRDKLKAFLRETLQWNLPQNDKQQSLIFLKVEFAYILARTLWDKFKLPGKPNESETKSMEDAIPIDCKPTYFLENGLFGCRDGFDFISAAIFEPSICLSSVFDIILNNKKLIINHQWLYESGIKLLYWLSQTPLYHISDIVNLQSEGSRCSSLEWKRFMQTRINAHYAIDPELNETVLSRDAHEDGKKFEDAMEKLVGKQKKDQLMQLELDLSIPILKKYANIMSQISGIDEDILIYELTLPDEEEKEKEKEKEKNKEKDSSDCEPPSLSTSLLAEYLNNPKFKDYKPVGLPVLVQNAEFNIIPSETQKQREQDGNAAHEAYYDRSKILYELSLLEKEVVQFQIDYKNQVYKVAGDKAAELDKVMSTLQYRGLELTKWLRNFVKYMIARRDIEQEIVDVSGKANHKEAMNWFESMTNYLNGANNVLLKIVSQLFMSNLVNAYNKYDHEQQSQALQYEKYEIYAGKKIEKLSSRYFELDCMVKFYVSMKKEFESVMLKEKFESLQEAETFLNDKVLSAEEVMSSKNQMLSALKMGSTRIAMLEIAIPATIIENQYGSTYKNWMRYPLTQTYVEKAKLFIERCKYLRDHVLCIIYSSVEKRCLLYPTLHTSPNKYFKCIGCQKIYAQLLCKNCNLAHYCSIQCQHQHWDKFHKRECKKYANLSSPTKSIVIQ